MNKFPFTKRFNAFDCFCFVVVSSLIETLSKSMDGYAYWFLLLLIPTSAISVLGENWADFKEKWNGS